jgi:indole-3-glycerol phosphate synthase
LKNFEVDLAVTEKLAPKVKEAGAFLISESGMKTLDDVKRVVDVGANGILVGETFMRAENLAVTLKEMKLPIQKAVQ